MADVRITLHSADKTITVDDEHPRASVSGKHKVKWTCHEGPFQIKFKPGSVWPDPVTTGSGGVWKAECGPFKTPDSKLQYAVESPGYTTLDPEIIIDR